MKNIKKILALALALVMVLGISSVALADGGTFASGAPHGTADTVLNNVKFTIDFHAKDGVSTPSVKFSYVLAQGVAKSAVAADSSTTPATPAKPAIKQGPADGATLAADSVTFAANDKTQKTIQINFDQSKFTQPGIYRYTIKQDPLTDAQKNAGVSRGDNYTDDTLYLDVYVSKVDHDNDASTEKVACVTQAVLHSDIDAQNDSTAKVTGFNNNYSFDDNDTPTDPTDDTSDSYDVTVKKLVAGDAADEDQLFAFTIDVGPMTQTIDADGISFAGVTFKYSVNGATDVSAAISTTAGSNTQFNGDIAHNQTIVIKGLPKGIAVTAAEDELDYTPTHEVTGMVTNAVANTAGNSASDMVLENGGLMTFTNTRTDISATGVALRVAPFVMILAAGCMMLLIGKRRKEAEEA